MVQRISREPTIENAQGRADAAGIPHDHYVDHDRRPHGASRHFAIQDTETTSSEAILSARDLAFEPTTVTVPASGEPIIITMTNDGAATTTSASMSWAST